MSLKETVEKLVNEHFDVLQRDQEIKNDLIGVLVDQKMEEFFSINWRKLHKEFGRRD